MLRGAEEQRKALESRAAGGTKRLAELERQLGALEDTEMALRAEKDELLAAKDQIEEEARGREAAIRAEVTEAVARADAAEAAQTKLGKAHAK